MLYKFSRMNSDFTFDVPTRKLPRLSALLSSIAFHTQPFPRHDHYALLMTTQSFVLLWGINLRLCICRSISFYATLLTLKIGRTCWRARMRYSNLIWHFLLLQRSVRSSAAENTSSHCKGDVCSFSRSLDLCFIHILFSFARKFALVFPMDRAGGSLGSNGAWRGMHRKCWMNEQCWIMWMTICLDLIKGAWGGVHVSLSKRLVYIRDLE